MPQVNKGQDVKVKSKRIEGDKGYSAIREMLEVKGNRIEVQGRSGWRVARKYHLSESRLNEKLENWKRTGVMPSPYTRGILSDLIASLVNLGVNQSHPLHLVMGEMRRIMSENLTKEQERELGRPSRVRDGKTDWERFEKKKRRTENGLGVVGKLIATALSLRKIDEEKTAWPIGVKLRQMGCCVDFFHIGEKTPDGRTSKCMVYLRLNTYSTNPLKWWYSGLGLIPIVDKRGDTKGPRA